jgi:GntR family transcriptional regulator
MADDLRAAIAEGLLGPGDRLPSQRELTERYGTAHATVRQALAVLKGEGLIATYQGRGVFVRGRPLRLRLESNHRFVTQAKRQDRKASVQLIGVEEREPPTRIAERLRLRPDQRVLALEYLLLMDDQPMQWVTSHFSADLVGGTAIAKPANISPGRIDAVFISELGRTPSRIVDELTTDMPMTDEVRRLQLMQGTPVVRLLRTFYDQNEEPIEVGNLVLAGDKHELIYEMPYPDDLRRSKAER